MDFLGDAGNLNVQMVDLAIDRTNDSTLSSVKRTDVGHMVRSESNRVAHIMNLVVNLHNAVLDDSELSHELADLSEDRTALGFGGNLKADLQRMDHTTNVDLLIVVDELSLADDSHLLSLLGAERAEVEACENASVSSRHFPAFG